MAGQVVQVQIGHLTKHLVILNHFVSKREMVSLIIALLLDNLHKNRDTFIPNLGGGV